MIKSNYEVLVECMNCGYTDEVLVEKGVEVKDAYCPNCDCNQLITVLNDEE